MPGDRILAQFGGKPGAGAFGVGQGFGGGEGLRADDEQGFRGVEGVGQIVQFLAIDRGDKMAVHPGVAEIVQGLVSHGGAEIGAADADVDDLAQGFAAAAGVFALVDRIDELRDALEFGVYGRHHVFAIDAVVVVRRRAQGHVHRGAVFGVVERLAGEQFLAPGFELAFFGQR